MRYIFLWLALMHAIVGLAGCDAGVKLGSFTKDRTAALSRTQDFRSLSDKQDFNKLYDLGAPALHAAVSKEQFVKSAMAAAAHFGSRKSSTLVASSCFPNEVRLVYHSEFERGVATEWMIWTVPGDAALLAMYKISPGLDPFDKDKQVGCPS